MRPESSVEILLVEDSPADAELTIRALKQGNVTNRIHVTRDGVEALEFLEATELAPRVILLDLKLPRLGGLEVLEKIRAHPRLKVLPVVILTSSQEEPDVLRAYQLGANSYIVKPVEFEGFGRAVAEAGLYWMLLNQPPNGTV